MNTITQITLWPLIGGILVAGIQDPKRAKRLALIIVFTTLALTLDLWRRFDATTGALQFVEKREWIPALGVNYFVGVDGLGLLMVLSRPSSCRWRCWRLQVGRVVLYPLKARME